MIVEQDRHTIGRQLYVDLDVARARGDCTLQRHKRVLGEAAGITTVGDQFEHETLSLR